jgi:hypothetical protein
MTDAVSVLVDGEAGAVVRDEFGELRVVVPSAVLRDELGELGVVVPIAVLELFVWAETVLEQATRAVTMEASEYLILDISWWLKRMNYILQDVLK